MSTDYEFRNITSKTLNIHFKYLSVITAAYFFTLIIYFMNQSQHNFLISIFLPVLIGSFFIVCNKIIITNNKICHIKKAYFISLSTAVVGLIFKIMHGDFSYFCLIFDIAVIFTAFYKDKILTSLAFLLNLFGQISIYLVNKYCFNIKYKFCDIYTSVIFLFLIYILSMSIIFIEKENQKTLEKLKLKTKIDSLTKLMNRKALSDSFKKIYNNEIETPSYFIIADIDNFKEINDTYGHLCGDDILRNIGQIFLKKEKMSFFRYGGDEFCAFIYINSLDEAVSEIKNIQKIVEQYAENLKTAIPIKLSFGLTHYGDFSSDSETIISQADYALYHSKKNNKGSISVFDNIDKSEYNDLCAKNI